MKTAIVVMDGDTQLILTPENEFERNTLASVLPNGAFTMDVMRGQFYECRGGWHRIALSEYSNKNDSVMLRAQKDDVPVEERSYV